MLILHERLTGLGDWVGVSTHPQRVDAYERLKSWWHYLTHAHVQALSNLRRGFKRLSMFCGTFGKSDVGGYLTTVRCLQTCSSNPSRMMSGICILPGGAQLTYAVVVIWFSIRLYVCSLSLLLVLLCCFPFFQFM
jgi:hypothetical protein